MKVSELMTKEVITTRPHKSIGHVRDVMSKNHIQAIPVVDSEKEVLGIVTANDLLKRLNDASPVGKIMTEKVITISPYTRISEAARCMRNHHIHHLVITHQQQVVGVISSYDLLRLVEEHHYSVKS